MPRRKRLTGEELVEVVLNKMFEIAGHAVTYNDVKDRKDEWYQQWTMTVKQNDEWRDWMVELFKKEMKLSKKQALVQANMYSLMWGLMFSDFE